MKLTYCSFADEHACLGVVVLEGHLDPIESAIAAGNLGLNPGGQLLAIPIDTEDSELAKLPFAEHVNELLTAEQAIALFDGGRLSDLRLELDIAEPLEHQPEVGHMKPGLIPLYGIWFLDTTEPVISLNAGEHETYWVPLAECQTHAAVLRWICHIAEKRTFSSEMVGDFVRSIEFVFDLRADFDSGVQDPELRAVLTVQSHLTPVERAALKATHFPDGSFMVGEYWAAYQAALKAERPFQWGARAKQLLGLKPTPTHDS